MSMTWWPALVTGTARNMPLAGRMSTGSPSTVAVQAGY
jgi:hypothetical protein